MQTIVEADPRFDELDEFIDGLEDKSGMLIGVLHRAQELFGYLPKEVQHHVADKLEIPESTVYGVVTFYSFFTMKPRGKYQIKVCLGTACYVKGGQKISDRVKEELKVTGDEPTVDGLFSVQEVRCLGACSMAPVMLIGERDFYGRLTPDKIRQIIDSYKRKENVK
jgi:NADH-quinone oxidoreductase subunit E